MKKQFVATESYKTVEENPDIFWVQEEDESGGFLEGSWQDEDGNKYETNLHTVTYRTESQFIQDDTKGALYDYNNPENKPTVIHYKVDESGNEEVSGYEYFKNNFDYHLTGPTSAVLEGGKIYLTYEYGGWSFERNLTGAFDLELIGEEEYNQALEYLESLPAVVDANSDNGLAIFGKSNKSFDHADQVRYIVELLDEAWGGPEGSLGSSSGNHLKPNTYDELKGQDQS